MRRIGLEPYPSRLSMNRPGHRIAACLEKAALKTHALQTLRDCRASPNRAKRLECVRFIGAFRPARDGQRFRVPMHDRKTEGALHEPECSAGFPACATSQSRFMVPMHAEKRKEALPEA